MGWILSWKRSSQLVVRNHLRCDAGRANTANASAMFSSSMADKSGYVTDHSSINLMARFQVWVNHKMQLADQEGNGHWLWIWHRAC